MIDPITVSVSRPLLDHLVSYRFSGRTVCETFFMGDRLSYPGRSSLEQELGHTDPYLFSHEARVLSPIGPSACIWILAGLATDRTSGEDGDLDLLWRAHRAHRVPGEGPSLDRLVASLVAVRALHDSLWEPGSDDDIWDVFEDAAERLVGWMHSVGLPPTHEGIEEICDGAYPACVGLGLIDL